MAQHFAGGRIHTLRRGARLTQAEMARRIGVSTSYLNQLENDQRPISVSVLLALTQAFDVDAGYFAPESDVEKLTALRGIFPDVPADQLSDLATRYPDLARGLSTRFNPAANPYDTVRDYFFSTRSYIHDLDVAGEELATYLGPIHLRAGRMAAALESDAGVNVNFRGDATGHRRRYDPLTRTLTLRTGLNEAQLCFEMALHYALSVHQDLLDSEVKDLDAPDARDVALLGLAQYFASAVTLPYSAVLEVAEDTRYDVDRIASHFLASYESTCHRLSSLQRPGAKGVPFNFVRIDRAGNVSKRQSARGVNFTADSATCPLWVVHRAFETPARPTRQVARMPDGRTYLWVARYVSSPTRGFTAPRREFAVALGCEISQAHRLVYSDGLNLSPDAATEIGPGCRLCPREQCAQRAFPQEGRRVVVDFHSSQRN
ncbi:helix-turn-helix domain-containing protein [Corynebacterium tapiri]|uniref:Helix-turn-helix domain-containing protein n=1 Tax=Corynebacterium tapiri TaxID=1448266 RepID=A0A5C4U444_9CORY|nr:short-chain fatty acyl-CoA regulator family protein [Corynebacterium tapiri]TNL98452.1 helix-turn-helix domain-containing protein [Corynebacterium tapiri]